MEPIHSPSPLLQTARSEDPRLQKAKRLAQSGKLKRAAEIFQAVLKSTPNDPDALHYCSIVMQQLGRPNKAMTLVKKSLSIAPDNPHALNSFGNFLKLREEYVEAEAAYSAALKIDPINAQCLNNLASIQKAKGEKSKAIASLEEAVRLAPDLAEAHFNLANLYYDQGRHDKALNAYSRSFKLGKNWRDPVFYAKIMVAIDRQDEAEEMLSEFLKHQPNHKGARHQLLAMRGETPKIADETYVADHFDAFAESFDGVLKGLDYNAPELIVNTVKDRLGEATGDKDILDLGCGTGLCGPLIDAHKRRLVGIDLSEGMLAQAAKLQCYDELKAAELQQFLHQQAPESFDVIICADTLVYIGALERTLAGVRKSLKPGGIFVASVEKLLVGDDDYILGISGRFQHSKAYLARLAEDHGLTIASLCEEVLRQEAGEPVIGYIVEYSL